MNSMWLNYVFHNQDKQHVCICLYGKGPAISVLRKLKLLHCVRLVHYSSVAANSYFWIYNVLNLEVKKQQELEPAFQQGFCTFCNKQTDVVITHFPDGRATDEGVRVETRCNTCQTHINLVPITNIV